MDNLSSEELPLVDAQMAGAEPIPRGEWEWFGSPGHCVISFDCHWHLTTRVGEWLVSTIGEYLPPEGCWEIFARAVPGAWEEINALKGDARRAAYLRLVGWGLLGSWLPGVSDGEKPLYETMVFWLGPERDIRRCREREGREPEGGGCDCAMPRPVKWAEAWCERHGSAGAAERGHLAACEKAARGDFADFAAEGEREKEEGEGDDNGNDDE